MTEREGKLWKSEYENLRRKNKKEIEMMKNNHIRFFNKTWKLLHILGMKDKDIIEFYKEEEQK